MGYIVGPACFLVNEDAGRGRGRDALLIVEQSLGGIKGGLANSRDRGPDLDSAGIV